MLEIKIKSDINEAKAVVVSGQDITYTFAFSEAVNDFTVDDVVVTNGTKRAFTQINPSLYTLAVTPISGFEGNITVNVAANVVTDIYGNSNVSATQSVQAIDTKAPTATITMSNSSLKAGKTSTVTITFSEAVINFTKEDLIVEKGTLSDVTSIDGGITWTAVFTPSINIKDTTNVISLANTYTDVAGNIETTALSKN